MINLPSSPGGQTGDEDEVPEGQAAPEDAPDPSTPVTAPVAASESEGPAETPTETIAPEPVQTPDVVVESAATPDAEVTPAPTPPPEHAPVALAAPTPAAPISASSLPANPVLAAPDTATVESMRERSRPPARRTGPSSTSSRPQAQTTPNVVPAPRPQRRMVRVRTASDGGRYVVRPGDSLWTIAQRTLGDDRSPSRVSAAVRALWHLNRTQIGTGDPDVLPVGITITMTKERA